MEGNVFGENLRRTRILQEDEKLRTQEGFAELIGVSQSTLSAYEKGSKTPTLEKAISIANKSNTSLDWLCGIKSEETNIVSYADVFKAIAFLCDYANGTPAIVNLPYHTDKEVGEIQFLNSYIVKYLSDYSKMKGLVESETIQTSLFDLWLSEQYKEYSSKAISPWDE